MAVDSCRMWGLSTPHFVFSGVRVLDRAAFDRELTGRLEALGYQLVECRVGGSARRPHFVVRIDRRTADPDPHGGVTVDDCARVSRALEAWLDQAEAGGGGRYILEVSSPGVDRPLKSAADWQRFAGQPVDVLVPALGGRFRVVARAVREGPEPEVELEFPKDVRRVIRLSDIKEARLAFEW